VTNISDLADIRDEVRQRWGIPDWERHYPWWPRPVTVKILFYADGGVRFDGGSFLGLKQVIATLTAHHYPWVRFAVTTVNRAVDPTATRDNLDLAAALALDAFDELWIYSAAAAPQLTAAELAAAAAFTDTHQGGVLITGDHADLGAAFGNLPRAGKMRQLPAPPAAPGPWNTTLRRGANAAYEFDDQSDSYPQPLRLKWYWGGWLWRAPHPLLCSPVGPIDIFPDHQHEGEAIAPPPVPAGEWPQGHRSEVIAWGTIEDPSSTSVGRQIGILSVYEGHQVGVGRIVADSTWHHHFDINLRGLPGVAGRSGFVTPGTGDWLTTAKKIEHFYVNAAIWLAPPRAQAAMRAAAWWATLWSDRVAQALDVIDRPLVFGRNARDALGRYAPQCLVFQWIWTLVAPHLRERFAKLVDLGDPPPYLDYVAGVVTRRLIERFEITPTRYPDPDRMPRVEEIEAVFEGAAQEALAHLTADADEQTRRLRAVAHDD
jgi:hypothetical protein